MRVNNKNLMRTGNNLMEIMASNKMNESSNDSIKSWIVYPNIEGILILQL